jgi:hypothetical protein
MFVAPLAGIVELTVGGVPAVVVKLHVTADASGMPSDDLTVVSSFAVYVVFAVSGEVDVSVAVLEPLSYVTVAATGEPPCGVSV